jgi:histidinol-phosphate/aromatic aminotransferase/cobyric acid decarboxylase-like protein
MTYDLDSGDSSIADLLLRHDELEEEHGDGDAGNFLSGWQCYNPYADKLLAAVKKRIESVDHTKYIYVENDLKLSEKVKQLQLAYDGVMLNEVFCAANGAASVLFTFCALLSQRGILEVYFVPPLYFSMHIALKLFGIRTRAISGFHAFEAEFRMNLPEKKTVLIIVDPVWYAGTPVPKHIISEIKEWQHRTSSEVFVDGSFQYMRWDCLLHEESSNLHPEKTFRLISPTKMLGVHGYRFAYLLLPKEFRAEFSKLYSNIYGSTSAANLAFAHEAIHAMKCREQTNNLMLLTKQRHELLRTNQVITSSFNPECGYFSFEQITTELPDGYILMSGDYFDQSRFPEHVRLNLISPSFYLIDPASDQ